MENAKSIIDIEVNDGEFTRFQELFKKYTETLGALPSVWKEVEVNAGKTLETEKEVTGEKDKQENIINRINQTEKENIQGHEHKVEVQKESVQVLEKERGITQALLDMQKHMFSALMSQNELIEENRIAREDAAKAEQKASDERRKSEKAEEDALKRQQKIIDDRNAKIKKMGSTLSKMVGSTMSIGLNLAKWGSGAALGLIGGGVFGMERLAANATAERTQSRGLGVSPGELRAWRTNFGNYGDPENLLSSASNAPTDALTRSLYQRAGVSAETIRNGNTSQIAESALRGLTNFFNRNQGPNAQAIWQGYGFDQIMNYNQMRQFAGASSSERENMFRNLHRDVGTLGTNDRTMRAEQDFYTQLQRSATMMKTTLIDGLVNLTGPIGELSKNLNDVLRNFMRSDGFKEMIQTISDGLKSLSDSMKDGSFNTAVHDLIGDIKGLASALSFLSPSSSNEPKVKPGERNPNSHHWYNQALIGGVAGSVAGALFGPEGIPIGGAIGLAGGALYGSYQDLGEFLFPQAHADTLTPEQRNRLRNPESTMPGYSELLNSIGTVESGNNPNAVSKSGAQGLYQLMPSVQRQYGVKNPFDPAQSRMGASRLLADLLNRFNGDTLKSVAAYNAGGGRVSGAIRKYGDDWLSHMPRETQQYVGRVAQNYHMNGVSININNTTGGAATVTARQAMGL